MNQLVQLQPPLAISNLSPRSCSGCSMHQICLPMGLDECDTQRLDKIIGRRKIARDTHLYRIGDRFTSLYAVRVGHFKSYQENLAGDRQITGFQMTGELLGMDAISSQRYQCDAVALDDSEVCEIPFFMLENLFTQMPTLLRHFHRVMSQEITSEQRVIMILGNMRAEQRFAAFLVNLSVRYATRGYSPTRFQLRMTREDIGNYLGLTIESISRMIAKMRKDGLIEVQQRNVEVLDLASLTKLAAGVDADEAPVHH
ncbi:fumarate/nitrate reduction transcriptional regulator Fnr [Herbaspirillum sp. RV1423]|uniref:fumarate/nitrate reduction transcriptional regulator Fnr n=1 Tax=Herbaspirillum sp. RV1423 TaxID=1443993 RepID=UPI0004BB3ADB|nr:fumarate/nitrate reduction transcriptional regulator Fnr [Herbaspirillum sp. RV1423]